MYINKLKNVYIYVISISSVLFSILAKHYI